MKIEERIDYLIEQVKELHDEPKTLCEDDIYGIVQALDEAKTKHGYWNGSECSVCHDDLSNYQYDMPNIVYPYCPFCGAKMDKMKG